MVPLEVLLIAAPPAPAPLPENVESTISTRPPGRCSASGLGTGQS